MASDSRDLAKRAAGTRTLAADTLQRGWRALAAQIRRVRPLPVVLGISALALLALAAGTYATTTTDVRVTIDGQSRQVQTHRRTVGGLLDSLGVTWNDADIIVPAPGTPLSEVDEVRVLRARQATVHADGSTFQITTHARTPGDIFRECGLDLGPADQVRVNGETWDVNAPLTVTHSNPSGTLEPLRLALRRAVPIEVEIDGARAALLTTASTVGAALRQEGILLYLGDLVRPGLGTPVSAGLKVFVERSVPVRVRVDHRTMETRTRQETVAEVLADERIHLLGRDYVALPLETAVAPNMEIRVVRVREAIEIEEESIPFETLWQPNSQLELDQQQVEQTGEPGLAKRRYRTTYEDGEPGERALEETWIDHEPTTRLLAYGTKIVPRELETPEGKFTYWRKIRALATSYTAATCGKDRDHPEYGITYLGWTMRRGIVAVDPRVISLRSKVYVPGYGEGIAGDTGGGIKGRRIDLGYEEEESGTASWYRWVDVYLLTPIPPRDQIRWVLPNWPVER